MSHSAGLRDFAAIVTSNDDAALGNQARSWKEDVFFTEPGKIYSYSSPGYWLAGLVVEEVGGKPYADAMDELLFKPLGMSRSTLRPSVAMTYPLTAGHRVENNMAVVIRPAFNNTARLDDSARSGTQIRGDRVDEPERRNAPSHAGQGNGVAAAAQTAGTG